jgi:hypothetical protein
VQRHERRARDVSKDDGDNGPEETVANDDGKRSEEGVTDIEVRSEPDGEKISSGPVPVGTRNHIDVMHLDWRGAF